MDIYSAEIQVKKLLNYVKGLSDSKSRMYQKSKDRLKELANTCNEVVKVISELIQDEALVNNDSDSSDEFGSSDNADYLSVLTSMESQLADLKRFLSPSSHSESNEETSDEKKQAMYTYKKSLTQLSTSSMCVKEAEDCGQLLYRWFSSRYLNSPDTFHYRIKQIPSWIKDIVILYGYHLEQNSIGSFKVNFQKWLESISEDNNYAVPYEIYKFDKHPDPKMMTLTSVVLWDILLDNGLRDCCKNSEMYLSDDCVYSMVGSLRSEVMDPYTNYAYDDSILKKCNLTMKAGDDE